MNAEGTDTQDKNRKYVDDHYRFESDSARDAMVAAVGNGYMIVNRESQDERKSKWERDFDLYRQAYDWKDHCRIYNRVPVLTSTTERGTHTTIEMHDFKGRVYADFWAALETELLEYDAPMLAQNPVTDFWNIIIGPYSEERAKAVSELVVDRIDQQLHDEAGANR